MGRRLARPHRPPARASGWRSGIAAGGMGALWGALWGALLVATLGAAPAAAQTSMAECRAALPPAPAAALRACDDHAGCRAVARIVDACPALRTFAELLVANIGGSGRVDDGVLRRALVGAGVPAPGLASCTSEFNRALCRNFLRLEDASGETAAGPTRLAQFEEAMRRLLEQRENARIPADAHRHAEVKLEACGAARPGPERDVPCREAIEAVRACELARQEWTQRRDVLRIDARNLGQTAALETLRTLEMPGCPQTLPGSSVTPEQALVAAAADVPPAPGGAPAPEGRTQAVRPPALTATAATTATTATAATTAAPTGAATPARADDCRVSLRRMEERFEAIQRRRPARPAPLAVQQVEIFMLTEQMGLLERSCRGQREHDFLGPTRERLARTLQACRESAANPVNDCVPRVAW